MTGKVFDEINKTSLWLNKFGNSRVALYNKNASEFAIGKINLAISTKNR